MAEDLAKLNRLRENAGKQPLKSWKASKAKLYETIEALEAQGHTDVLPGANVDTQPKTDDPEVAKAVNTPPEKEDPPQEPKVTKVKSGLARGTEKDEMARNCRQSVRDDRRKEAEEAKAAKKAEKKTKPKAEDKPDKKTRQKAHIEKKRKARNAPPPKEKNPNEISVADIARELDIDPKVARAKLRRHEDKITKLHSKGQDRWTFPLSAKDKIIEILK